MERGPAIRAAALSAADVLTYLYFREMRIDPEQPQDPNRDRFVLSKGHCAPGLYAALAERGFFPVADLPTLRHSNSYLQGHPNMNTVPGVDMSHRQPGARVFRRRPAWRWAPSRWAATSTSTPCWATARSTRARLGGVHVRQPLQAG